MGTGSVERESIAKLVCEVLARLTNVEVRDIRDVRDDEDVFNSFGLNSMDLFAAVAELEKRLDVVFGEDPSDFERIRTFAGLCSLIQEKCGNQRSFEPAGREA